MIPNLVVAAVAVDVVEEADGVPVRPPERERPC